MAELEAVLLISARTEADLRRSLEARRSAYDPAGDFRLAILGPTDERLAKALEIVRKGQACRGLQGIWFSPGGLLRGGGKLAFMYPGIDSLARPDTADVAQRFGIPSRDPAPPAADGALESRGLDVFFTSDLFTRVLAGLRLKPHAMLGHSIGEWSGVVASRLTPAATVDETVRALAPGMLPVPGLVFAALGCGVDQARAAIQGLGQIEVSHDNCPHQSILCGEEASVDVAIARLKDGKVMCQKLDFRSGFHTRLFAPFKAPVEASIRAMAFAKPETPLWSATSCGPYPETPAEIRELMIRHLLEPVRFRELTLAMYDQGFRVFAQIGAGSLPGFVDDTLRGKPHLAVSTCAPGRPGLPQLQKFCLALFAEGADFDGTAIWGEIKTVAAPAPASAAKKPQFSLPPSLAAELDGLFADMQAAARDVTAALQAAARLKSAFKRRTTLTLRLEDRPELIDHCFYKQRAGWKSVTDRFPVMPLTGSIDLVIRLAREQFPELEVIAIENVSATKWVAVDVPKTLEIDLEFDGRDRLKVTFVGHFTATAVLAGEYPGAPAPREKAIERPRAFPAAAEEIYRDHWLFHGPDFQCISRVGPIGDNGMDGAIRATPIPGALLDNAGQLAGLCIMESVETDRYAMPIAIRRLEFFGPMPTEGEVSCQVRIDRIRSRDIMSHFELGYRGAVWARIEGWENWRFECDDRLWGFLRGPGRAMISESRGTSTWLERPDMSGASADDLARRYLREEERAIYTTLGRKKDAWICGRVAAKDAVRHYLWSHGYADEIFPAEIWIVNDERGQPHVRECPGGRPLFVSISHKKGLGVARVSEAAGVGIDVESLEPRNARLEQDLLGEGEIALIPPGAERAEWLTRIWSAKETYGKSRGLGLQGNPKGIRITEFRGDRIRVEETWIRSTQVAGYILSETEDKESTWKEPHPTKEF